MVPKSACGQLNTKNRFHVPVCAGELILVRRVRPSRPASACSFSTLRLNLVLSPGLLPFPSFSAVVPIYTVNRHRVDPDFIRSRNCVSFSIPFLSYITRRALHLTVTQDLISSSACLLVRQVLTTKPRLKRDFLPNDKLSINCKACDVQSFFKSPWCAENIEGRTMQASARRQANVNLNQPYRARSSESYCKRPSPRDSFSPKLTRKFVAVYSIYPTSNFSRAGRRRSVKPCLPSPRGSPYFDLRRPPWSSSNLVLRLQAPNRAPIRGSTHHLGWALRPRRCRRRCADPDSNRRRTRSSGAVQHLPA